MKLKLFLFLLITTGLVYVGYEGYRNYQRNEMISEMKDMVVLSDFHSQFKKRLTAESDYAFSASLLDSISRIKKETMKAFLASTKEKIVFAPMDKDTLEIKVDNASNFSYSSSLDKGLYDKNYNDLLVDSLVPFLRTNNLEDVKIFTLTPTKWNNVPPPPGMLKNFDPDVQ